MAEIYIIMGTYDGLYPYDGRSDHVERWVTGAFMGPALADAHLAKLNALNASIATRVNHMGNATRLFSSREQAVEFAQDMAKLDANYWGDDYPAHTEWEIIATTLTGGPQHG